MDGSNGGDRSSDAELSGPQMVLVLVGFAIVITAVVFGLIRLFQYVNCTEEERRAKKCLAWGIGGPDNPAYREPPAIAIITLEMWPEKVSETTVTIEISELGMSSMLEVDRAHPEDSIEFSVPRRGTYDYSLDAQTVLDEEYGNSVFESHGYGSIDIDRSYDNRYSVSFISWNGLALPAHILPGTRSREVYEACWQASDVWLAGEAARTKSGRLRFEKEARELVRLAAKSDDSELRALAPKLLLSIQASNAHPLRNQVKHRQKMVASFMEYKTHCEGRGIEIETGPVRIDPRIHRNDFLVCGDVGSYADLTGEPAKSWARVGLNRRANRLLRDRYARALVAGSRAAESRDVAAGATSLARAHRGRNSMAIRESLESSVAACDRVGYEILFDP